MKKYLPICIIVLLSVVSLSIYGKEDKKEEFKTNTIKENENKFTIAAYINGVYSDTMPTESKYFGYVECRDNSGNKLDTLGFVEWENNKWNVRITDITKASTCNVYFIDPPAHWLDAGEGTLLKAIKDNNKVENVKTIPGKQINKEDEAVLSGTLDDYGTSYYFRGNVQNNYVQFANKCWKIVRITGDGSIKLVLYNNNGIDCSNYNSAGTSVFNNESGVYNKPIGVGFMYGNTNASNYNEAQANLYDSIILSNLKVWYDTTFETKDETNPTKYTNLLADVIWCGDKSIYSGDGYSINETTRFKSLSRIYYKSSDLVLKCPEIKDNPKLSKYTAYDTINGNGVLYTQVGNSKKYYLIGLLTADEVAFAGGITGKANSDYYLYSNTGYWTMTPSVFDETRHNSKCVIVYSSGMDTAGNPFNNVKHEIRPSIALNYNVQATYNTESEYAPGTVNNPYIVS